MLSIPWAYPEAERRRPRSMTTSASTPVSASRPAPRPHLPEESRGELTLVCGRSDPSVDKPLIDPHYLRSDPVRHARAARAGHPSRPRDPPRTEAPREVPEGRVDALGSIRTSPRKTLRAAVRLYARTIYHPGRHLQAWASMRAARGGRSRAARARHRRAARRGRVDHAAHHRRQHECAEHHDRREGRRPPRGRLRDERRRATVRSRRTRAEHASARRAVTCEGRMRLRRSRTTLGVLATLRAERVRSARRARSVLHVVHALAVPAAHSDGGGDVLAPTFEGDAWAFPSEDADQRGPRRRTAALDVPAWPSPEEASTGLPNRYVKVTRPARRGG